MNRTVYETYIMYLWHRWKIHELVMSKYSGGVFAERVIASSINENYMSVQRHFHNIYEHGWFTQEELEVIRLDEEPALKAGGV